MAKNYSKRVSIKELMAKRESEASLELTAQGAYRGEVTLTAADGSKYICAREYSMGVLSGDRALCKQTTPGHCVVKQVTYRAHEFIIGVLKIGREGRTVLAPTERRVPSEIALRGSYGEAQLGDIVRCRVVRWDNEGGLQVMVEDRIGTFEQARTAMDALVMSQKLRTEYPIDVIEQADACKPADLADDPTREDLRELVSFTIDGRSAKDFDDAVSLTRTGDGLYELGVHIADVGHYVPEGTPLDREAWERGTSVYMPGRVYPMLPEQLSNGVCSLRPDEDKFTMSALMVIDEKGNVVRSRVARTITRSKMRLVYDDVNAMFEGDEEQLARMAHLKDILYEMRTLAGILRKKREADGSIDFETEEPEFVLDEDGEPIEIVKRDRGFAEVMIEDFMLTANECVARFAREHDLPLLYRVHENPDPEKLILFSDFLSGIGAITRRINPGAKPLEIREVIESTRERPEYQVITTLALRAMAKARYDVKPLGHYGLSMADYCHFTSPIRRYPDLVVSRALTACLKGQPVKLYGQQLEEAAQQSSECERKAVETERAADKLMCARYMAHHVGETYEGTVSGVTENGVYVMLSCGAEGFIPVRTLNDWFAFDEGHMLLRGERSGAVISLGMPLTVEVSNVSLEMSAVDLLLKSSLMGESPNRSERKRERDRMRSFSRY